jgi:hypothetical protein
MSDSTVLCPSWRCEPGASLIGIVLPDGTVAFSKERIVVDAAFVEVARQGRSPEKRFRFSSTCKRAACVQWTKGRCGIADLITSEQNRHTVAPEQPFALPECSIRPLCRWHLQSGDAACRACPQVVTDATAEDATEVIANG